MVLEVAPKSSIIRSYHWFGYEKGKKHLLKSHKDFGTYFLTDSAPITWNIPVSLYQLDFSQQCQRISWSPLYNFSAMLRFSEISISVHNKWLVNC